MLAKRIISALLCLLLTSPCLAYTRTPFGAYQQPAAEDTAQILGIKTQLQRYKELCGNADASPEELLFLKTLILRKILRGVLEVRQACNKLDLERAYTYDILQKEERREHFIYQLYNTASFAQLSTFYTLEPFARIHDQFVTSAIFTTTSGSLNTAISTFSRVHGRLAKASNVAPPRVLSKVIDGGPVDTSGLPPLVTKYLDAKAPNAEFSRRELLFANWLKQYKIDAGKKEALCSLNDKKKVGVKLLRSRILLIWSLHTFIQDFDRQLLVLLNYVQNLDPSSSRGEMAESVTALSGDGISGGVSEMTMALHLRPQLEELRELRRNGSDNDRVRQLDLAILAKTLRGALELQVASDKVDEDLYYNYHIILSDLLQNRAKWLQLNYNANFLQSGILGIVAGRLYLSRRSFPGDRKFVISGGIGTSLTTLAMLQMRGGRRKVDTAPNSLAEAFNLHPDEDDRFSLFVSNLLNAPPPGSTDGRSRRELLNDSWRKANITAVNLDSSCNQAAVSAMPTHKFDTIKIVESRIALLHSLKKELESFQDNVLSLLVVPSMLPPAQARAQASARDEDVTLRGVVPAAGGLTYHAREAARLLGIEGDMEKLLEYKKAGKLDSYDSEACRLQLVLLRRVMTTGLELRTVAAHFDSEITLERQALDKLIRQRDFVVAATNDVNFLQLGILSMIIDGPLEQTKNPHKIIAGNRLNIVSGLTVGALALLALLEQRGGYRKSPVETNLLAETLGLNPPSGEKLPPVLWTYLNSPANAPDDATRREKLLQYWRSAGVLPVNIKKPVVNEQLAACGEGHRRRCETIKLITARVTMLFDLRAMIDRLNIGLVELLQALD